MHILILIFVFCFFADSISQNSSAFFYDSFDNLNNWEKFTFSSDKKSTEYNIINYNSTNMLQIKSETSASGLISKTKFNPNKYPLLKWKWKVENIITSANGKTKEGDDYPLRIFVMFEKDSSEISFWEKLEKSAIKLMSGYNPPYKSICYVWANSEENNTPYLSPYSNDVMIIPLQAGPENCTQWIDESVNFAEDYKNHFETEIPSIACIAIMGDTDNTRSQTVAFIDDMKIE